MENGAASGRAPERGGISLLQYISHLTFQQPWRGIGEGGGLRSHFITQYISHSPFNSMLQLHTRTSSYSAPPSLISRPLGSVCPVEAMDHAPTVALCSRAHIAAEAG